MLRLISNFAVLKMCNFSFIREMKCMTLDFMNNLYVKKCALIIRGQKTNESSILIRKVLFDLLSDWISLISIDLSKDVQLACEGGLNFFVPGCGFYSKKVVSSCRRWRLSPVRLN